MEMEFEKIFQSAIEADKSGLCHEVFNVQMGIEVVKNRCESVESLMKMMESIINHSMAGWQGFIFTASNVNFFFRNRKIIWQALLNDAEEIGEEIFNYIEIFNFWHQIEEIDISKHVMTAKAFFGRRPADYDSTLYVEYFSFVALEMAAQHILDYFDELEYQNNPK